MFFPFLPDWRRIEEAFPQKPGWIEQTLRPVLQRTSQPRIDGYTEAHLGPLDQLSGHMTIEHLSKQPLGDPSAHLKLRRQTPSKLHKPVVQKRYSRFQRHPHRCSVHFDQNLV